MHTVQVTADEAGGYHFILSSPSVTAGKVTLEFVNHGQDPHNLNAVEPTAGEAASPPPENIAPNARQTLTLNLHHGSYTLFCSLQDHEAKGMKATLKVE